MSKLRATAQSMRLGLDWAKQTGKPTAWNMRTLPRGLQMLLSYQEEEWRLALRREGVPPSEEEITLCLAAFDIPDDCSRARRTRKETKYHQTVTYHIVELTWREYDPIKHPERSGAQSKDDLRVFASSREQAGEAAHP